MELILHPVKWSKKQNPIAFEIRDKNNPSTPGNVRVEFSPVPTGRGDGFAPWIVVGGPMHARRFSSAQSARHEIQVSASNLATPATTDHAIPDAALDYPAPDRPYFIADASSAGFAPGHWPRIVSIDGQRLQLVGHVPIDTMAAADCPRLYKNATGTLELHVLNT